MDKAWEGLQRLSTAHTDRKAARACDSVYWLVIAKVTAGSNDKIMWLFIAKHSVSMVETEAEEYKINKVTTSEHLMARLFFSYLAL